MLLRLAAIWPHAMFTQYVYPSSGPSQAQAQTFPPGTDGGAPPSSHHMKFFGWLASCLSLVAAQTRLKIRRHPQI